MRKFNVLVTGIGAIIGYGIIHSLKMSEYDVNIVGMDIYDDAVGQFWCDEFIQAIPARNVEYIAFLTSIIDDKKIDLVFFGTEQEIQKCHENRDILGSYFEKLVINTSDILKISEDKWQTYNFLISNGFETIDSSIHGTYAELVSRFGLPFLLKPKRSYASKGIVKVENEEDYFYWKKRMGENCMAQMIVGDTEHEYTAATFCFGDGECLAPIMFRRKLSLEGATTKAVVISAPEIEQQIRSFVRILKPIGPTNFQFRLHDGNYLLLEFNPRISSSTSIRAALGYNESAMCIGFYLLHNKPKDAVISQGKAIRYISDYIIKW